MNLDNKFPKALPELPFLGDDLEPYMSKNTLSFHYDKHHRAYVGKSNELIANTEFEQLTILEILKRSHGKPDLSALYNNVAQSWNHWFFWKGMKAKGGGAPTGEVAKIINDSFGDFEKFKTAFSQAGVTQFGSGWVWLVMETGGLKIMKTSNAENPLHLEVKPLLTMDVWEHAYYLDFQNRRPDFISSFLDHLVNWDFVNSNL
jgi:Fe-Mn family superoxide dismutase